MEPAVDLKLVALFGSETRLRTLAVLAGAYRPMTAYRVAKVGDVPVQKAYEELRRLGATGLVAKQPGGWVLADRDVRTLLAKRVRISWADDWFAERARRISAEGSILQRLRVMPRAKPPKGWQPRNPERFVRSPAKDRILREMGLRTSLHAG
ncbi:MAG: helix-turn-helix domain-containing protein [Thermoplasmata archaeon]